MQNSEMFIKIFDRKTHAIKVIVIIAFSYVSALQHDASLLAVKTRANFKLKNTSMLYMSLYFLGTDAFVIG